MAYRLTVSDRATREIGEAYDWYQEQSVGLGDEFLEALDLQFQANIQTPRLYAQTQRGVRRALLRVSDAFEIIPKRANKLPAKPLLVRHLKNE